jgi:hypothetical protein
VFATGERHAGGIRIRELVFRQAMDSQVVSGSTGKCDVATAKKKEEEEEEEEEKKKKICVVRRLYKKNKQTAEYLHPELFIKIICYSLAYIVLTFQAAK